MSVTQTRAPPGPVPIQRYGKYYLVSKLAEGGMAEIFLAKQVGVEGFEKNVVVKRMLAHLSGVSDFVAMFLDEARLASRLGHPNVVQVLDLGFEEGCYFIAMEYLPGEDFSTMIRSAARQRAYVPLNIALKVLADAAHGLNYAHEFTDSKGQPLNVVHRDVSPSNIFVTYSGQVKVLDFGIAKAESRVTNTTAGVVKGKYQYMAPEQAQSGPIDRRADVYSLGVCMYEALCNSRPFARDTDLAILNAVLKNEYRPPRLARPDLPVELEQIVVKALARDAKDRFQSAGDFAGAIENYLRASTSVTSGTAVAQYMSSFFGPERVAQKTRIDSLDDLKARGIALPSEKKSPSNPSNPSGASMVAPLPRTSVSQSIDVKIEDATAAIGAPRSVVEKRTSSRRVLFAAIGALIAGIGLTVGVIKALEPPKDPAPKDPIVVPPPKVDPPPVIDAGEPTPPPPPVIDAGVTAAPEPQLDAGLTPKLPQPPRCGVLGTQTISATVRKNAGPLQKCLQDHKDEIAGVSRIEVRITIERSGKVREAAVLGAQADTSVGRCLTSNVKAIRFPCHTDESVTVTIPLTPR
jgi:serine/threonine-protein kinase